MSTYALSPIFRSPIKCPYSTLNISSCVTFMSNALSWVEQRMTLKKNSNAFTISITRQKIMGMFDRFTKTENRSFANSIVSVSANNVLYLTGRGHFNSNTAVLLNAAHALSWPVIALSRRKGQHMPMFWPRRTACRWDMVIR